MWLWFSKSFSVYFLLFLLRWTPQVEAWACVAGGFLSLVVQVSKIQSRAKAKQRSDELTTRNGARGKKTGILNRLHSTWCEFWKVPSSLVWLAHDVWLMPISTANMWYNCFVCKKHNSLGVSIKTVTLQANTSLLGCFACLNAYTVSESQHVPDYSPPRDYSPRPLPHHLFRLIFQLCSAFARLFLLLYEPQTKDTKACEVGQEYFFSSSSRHWWT